VIRIRTRRGQEEETEREREGAVKSHHDQGYCRWQKAFMGGKGKERMGREG
jgi:hypothetical protein